MLAEANISVLYKDRFLSFFKDFIYLFMRERESERQREKQAPTRSPIQDSIPDPRITP